MGTRLGLGPVFAYEWLTQSRRWQHYALRSLFGLGLLATMAVVWSSGRNVAGSRSIQAFAEIGQAFFLGLTGTQLALVLLAAPAAAAGAICLDKQRGALTHLLVTDLSDAEIILGKLAARLVPVFGLLLASLPIVALAMLLGGIDPRALLGSFLILIGLVVLGCSLALTISVWASKTQEVLLATYALLCLWLMAIPIAYGLDYRGGRGWWGAPDWLVMTNPFFLAFLPYLQPGTENLSGGAVFLVVCLAISAVLAAVATAKLRPVAANPRIPRVRKPRASGKPSRRWKDLLPGPSLDANPVLWREWHRSRPSRITARIWAVYLGLFGLFAVLSIGDERLGVWSNGFGATIGLLLISVGAATSLSEERVRGSLDVLLTTPMATSAIVWGKWWGAARAGLAPAIPMMIVAIILAARTGVWYGPPLILAYYLGLVGLISSIGLAMATLISRPGRAVAATVTAYLALTVGVFFLVLASGLARDDSFLGHASPFFAFIIATASCSRIATPGSWALTHAVPFWAVVWFGVAAILLWVTIAVFDRCLGRASESPRLPRGNPSVMLKTVRPAAALE